MLPLKRLLMGDQSASAHSLNPGGIIPLTAPHTWHGEADGGDGPDRRDAGRCCGEAAGDGPDDVSLDVGLDVGLGVGRWRDRWEPFRGGVVRAVRPRPPRSRAAARRLASPCTAAITCSRASSVMRSIGLAAAVAAAALVAAAGSTGTGRIPILARRCASSLMAVIISSSTSSGSVPREAMKCSLKGGAAWPVGVQLALRTSGATTPGSRRRESAAGAAGPMPAGITGSLCLTGRECW